MPLSYTGSRYHIVLEWAEDAFPRRGSLEWSAFQRRYWAKLS